MSDAPLRVVVVGGGTAGWLAALMLAFRLRATSRPFTLTVIESSAIPVVGVGEGTTAVFRLVLQRLGLDEAAFVRETGATVKFGIRHRDWRRLGHVYDGPIDDPHAVSAPGGDVPWLDVAAVAAGKPVARHRLFQYLLSLDKGPYARRPDGSRVALGPYDHAFHFDQARVGQWLAREASRIAPDIVRLDATVERVELAESTDRIAALVARDGQRVEGDFFIDCTGFGRRLVGGALGSRWVSYREDLPLDRALPFRLAHAGDGHVPAFTEAWAQRSGWLWRIPTQERIGCGYVYSSAHCTAAEAQAEIEGVLGQPIEPRAELAFEAGRLDLAWRGNALALGLASSFLEPLEATSIHGTIVQLMLLTERHLDGTGERLRFTGRDDYNRTVAGQVDDFRDFINLHYAGERDDSDFWRDMRGRISDVNRERIARWRRAMPRREEFASLPGGLPHVEAPLQYPVLDGLGLLHADTARTLLAAHPATRSRARKLVEELAREYRRAAARAEDHGQYLRALGAAPLVAS